MKWTMTFMFLLPAFLAGAQAPYKLRPLTEAPIASMRGLSVVSDNVLWVSGTAGKAGRSLDAGKTWEWFTLPGCDSVDFRDVEAFSADRAIVMGIAEPARVFLTTDGGKNWKQVYYNAAKGMFLDGLDFQSGKEGMAVGDPINGRFFLIRTANGGESWQPLEGPAAGEGEAIFAASGTTIRALPGGDYAIFTGGMRSRFFRYSKGTWTATAVPALQGVSSAGMFSFAFRDARYGVAVGGDYTKMQQTGGNCLVTADGGRSWQAPAQGPAGYREAVEFIDNQHLVATGPTGTDVSVNGGQNWETISTEGYHTARKAKKGKVIYLTGYKGRIAVLEKVK